MIKDMVIHDFLGELSSKSPTPGGGGASALAGAQGAALGLMVIHLTLGKKKYAEAEEEMKELESKLQILQKEFLRLADEDAVVFAPLAASYSLPAQTDEEKIEKDKILEYHLREATLIPLSIMEGCLEAMEMLEVLAVKGSRLAVSDVGVGIQFLRTALLGAIMNVMINTRSMKDRKQAEKLNNRADEMRQKGTEKAEGIYQLVVDALQ